MRVAIEAFFDGNNSRAHMTGIAGTNAKNRRLFKGQKPRRHSPIIGAVHPVGGKLVHKVFNISVAHVGHCLKDNDHC